MKTESAKQFIESAKEAWDHFDCWQATAKQGLSEVDVEALEELCERNNEDYEEAEREVMQAIKERVEFLRCPDLGEVIPYQPPNM